MCHMCHVSCVTCKGLHGRHPAHLRARRLTALYQGGWRAPGSLEGALAAQLAIGAARPDVSLNGASKIRGGGRLEKHFTL